MKELNIYEYNKIKNIAFKKLSNKYPYLIDELEGIIDEAICEALNKINDENYLSYITNYIANRRCIDNIRKNKKHNNTISYDSFISEDDETNFLDTFNMTEKLEDEITVEKAMISYAMKILEKDEKNMITMKFYENYTYEEIGKEFNISGVAVRKKIQKALLKMRKRLEG